MGQYIYIYLKFAFNFEYYNQLIKSKSIQKINNFTGQGHLQPNERA